MKYVLVLLLMVSSVLGKGRISDVGRFGKAFEDTLFQKNESFHDFVSYEGVFDRIVDGVEVSSAVRSQFVNELRKAKFMNGLFNSLRPMMKEYSEVRFISSAKVDGFTELSYRVSFEDEGLNIVSFLVKKEDGKLKVHDFLSYTGGAFLSETCRPIYLKILADVDKNILEKLFQKNDKSYYDDIQSLIKVSQLTQSGNYMESLKQLQTVKGSVKDTLFYLVLEIQIYNALEQYDNLETTLDKARKAYPHLKSFDFLSIDIYATKEEYKKGLIALKNIQTKFPKDAHIEVLKGMQELLVNDFDTKYYKKSSIKAKKLDPGSMTPYLMDFVIYAHRSDYFKDLAISLKTFKEKFKREYTPVKSSEDFAEFRKSQYYKLYLKAIK